MKTLQFRTSTNRSPLRISFILFALLLTCFGLSPASLAQLSPPPDGGYPNDNTAEGADALFSVTTGDENTAVGFNALVSLTTGGGNTAIGRKALVSNTTGDINTAVGDDALYSNTTGLANTANGFGALVNNAIGTRNTATGAQTLSFNTTGSRNTATGYDALFENTTGNHNAAYGWTALFSNTTGNVALGDGAGDNLTTGDNNIDIGNEGFAAEANTIRVGTQGTQTKTFIAGISGAGVTGVAVKVNAAGQLGRAPSAARFKDEIKPMDKTSEAILALKPVTFRYKKELDPDGIPQFGLVAEDVAAVTPDLVVRDKDGEIYTVRYDAVNAMLLNEFLKEHRKVEEQQATITQLKKDFRATVAQLTKRLDEQAAQIQKVSVQLAVASPSRGGLEMSRPAPQMAWLPAVALREGGNNP
jgi:Chaperone of endosialidase